MTSAPWPSARTTPASSAPGTNGKGGFTWYCPRTMRRSKKLQPAARTSTARVPGASSGSGASRTRRSAGSIQRSTTIARMRYSIADDAGPTQPARKERPHARGRPARQRRHAAPVRERARERVGDAARARRVVGPPPPHARLPPLHPRGHEHRRGPAGRRVVALLGGARPDLLRAARRHGARRQPERDALPRAAGRAEGRGPDRAHLIASTTFVPAGGSRSTAVVSSRRAIIM